MEQKVSGASLKRQVTFWVIVLAVFVVFLPLQLDPLALHRRWMSVAYFLDPVADRLEKLGLSRFMATIVILVAFVLVFASALTIFIPDHHQSVQRFPSPYTGLRGAIPAVHHSYADDDAAGLICSQLGAIRRQFLQHIV